MPTLPPAPYEFFAVTPRQPLARFIESLWAVRGDVPYRRSLVLPNGALQLMVNFGAPHRVIGFGASSADKEYRSAWIAGLQDAPLAIESPAFSDLFSIRFRPGGAHAFVPLPLAALTNDVLQAADILGAATADLRERLVLASSRADQVRIAEDWLLARLRPRDHDYALVLRAVEALRVLPTRSCQMSVSATCDQLGLSNKHLIHVFRTMVGLPPKAFARVQRFHQALRRLPSAGSRAALALELGYADQAHFNNEFRRFAGVTPRTFVERRGEDDESMILG